MVARPISLVVLALLVVSAPAAAGDGGDIDLRSFAPAMDSQGFITVNSPSTLDHGALSLGLVTTWAHSPLRLQDGDRVYEVENVIAPTLVSAVGLRLGALAVELGASLPFVVVAGDRSPDDDGGTPDDPNDDESFAFDGQGVGDIGIHTKLGLLDPSIYTVGLGLVASITLPTATERRAWLGHDSATARLSVAVEHRRGRWRLAANGGYHYRGAAMTEYRDEGGAALPYTGGVIRVGSSVPVGVASSFAISPGRLDVLGELFGDIPLDGENFLPFEAAAAARVYLAERSYLSVGGGLGLAPSEGGNADLRAFLAIVLEPRASARAAGEVIAHDPPPPEPAILDRDGDGILDPDDACPDDPEDFDEFDDADGCPDLDNDGDGILDVDDLCPDDPEDLDGFEDDDGCPELDNDRDRILDTDDQCPGKDGEAIVDTAEVYNGIRDDDGCPDGRIRMGSEIMVVLDKIHFEYDSATIRSVSFPILDEIAATLIHNPHLERIEVQGHTDERGSHAYNDRLSQRRAESVVRYLARAGVEISRLIPVGYGERVPKDRGHHESAWAVNRRVEFHIR